MGHRRARILAGLAAVAIALAGCSGGGGSSSAAAPLPDPAPQPAPYTMATPPSVYTLYEPVVILEQSGVYAGRSDLGMQWDGPADAWYVPDAWRVSWPTAVYAQPADYPWRGYLRVASDFKAHEMRVALTDAGTMRVELVAWENNSGNVAGRLVCEVSPVPVGAG